MKKVLWAGLGMVLLVLAATDEDSHSTAPARTETPQVVPADSWALPKKESVLKVNAVPEVASEPVPAPVVTLVPVTTKKPTPAPVKAYTAPSYSCNCSKTCPQMSSCREAYYQLNSCGCSRRDGDNDGVPCESICR